jgi:Animal haem peroxidase
MTAVLPPSAHSCVLVPHLKAELSTVSGKYGRMFPDLPPLACTPEALAALARSGAPLDAGEDERAADTADTADIACTPAGWPIFGQLIAHNITADRSLLQVHANLGELRNGRSPSLNLESLYGAGPSGSPYLYDRNDPDLLLLGETERGRPDDLPRNAQGTALIGDPRDDVHLPISQLHVAFLKFHNAVVRSLRAAGGAAGGVFAQAQALVRWHVQWIVVHEYLPLVAGADTVHDVLANGRRYFHFEGAPFIPIEFADGAYRFGHSQIRATYRLNERVSARLFPDLMCGCPTLDARVIDWRYFFDLDPARPPQRSRRIDGRLAHPLIDLPQAITGEVTAPEQSSLAYRDLLRSEALDMPSGEAVARVMGIAPLRAKEIGLDAVGWKGETPLWLYILKEAEARTSGVALGPVGGRIVVEVLLGLLEADSSAYLAQDRGWRPVLPAMREDFTLADLFHIAGT